MNHSIRLDNELAGRAKELHGDLDPHHPTNPIGSSWPSMAIGPMETTGGPLRSSTCPNNSNNSIFPSNSPLMAGGDQGGNPALPRAASGSPSQVRLQLQRLAITITIMIMITITMIMITITPIIIITITMIVLIVMIILIQGGTPTLPTAGGSPSLGSSVNTR